VVGPGGGAALTRWSVVHGPESRLTAASQDCTRKDSLSPGKNVMRVGKSSLYLIKYLVNIINIYDSKLIYYENTFYN
jgi:hypothetical protein